MQYKEIITINDRTSLEQAAEWGTRCGEQFRKEFALGNLKIIFEFLNDADFTRQLQPFTVALGKIDHFNDLPKNKNTLGWCRHTLPSYVFLNSMLRAVLTDVYVNKSKELVTQEIKRSWNKKEHPELKTFRDYELFLISGMLFSFQPVCAYYSNDTNTFHEIECRCLKMLEKRILKGGPDPFVLRFAGYLSYYLDFLNSKVFPILDVVEADEKKKLNNLKTVQVYQDAGFKNSAFSVLA